MPVHVEPQELNPLLRVQGTRKKMWIDDGSQVHAIKGNCQGIEQRLAKAEGLHPIRERAANMRSGYGRRHFFRLPSSGYYVVNTESRVGVFAGPDGMA